jgi:hypothetical protein
MYYVKNKQVEVVCTLNHKLYVSSETKVSPTTPSFELIEAENIMGKTVKFKKNMNNNQSDLEFIFINDTKISCNAFLLSIIFESNCDDDDFIIDVKNIFLIDEDKLPDYIWNMSKKQCLIILNVIKKIKTKSINLANDISRFYIHCGYSGIIELCNKRDKKYKVILVEDNEPFINYKEGVVGENLVSLQEKLIDYEGKVYCVEMPSSHLYYMRENNFAPSMLIGNSRAGQKGTVGLIIPEEDMPFTADGIRPDLIINPHALPSRMTIGQLVESLFGKACCMYGAYGDCTAFSTKGANYETYGHMLTKMGYHNSGNQILYNGFTGEQIYSEIFIGPTYYMRLKHMVKDKINYRATGKRNFLTRQTNQGRANDGGLKIGEMERDGIMAHGLSYFLNESYMVRGDQYYMAICNKTGAIAVYNSEKNLFLSPFADGPLVFNRNVEGQEILDAISKFGRTFSVVRIPFALKLLIQELQVMNIQMRIITEDNIDQLTNLSYQSRNIDNLLHIDHGDDGKVERDIKEIINNYKKSLETKLKQVEQQQIVQIYPDYDVEPQSFVSTPDFAPNTLGEERDIGIFETGNTPPELQTGSPQYAPGSPAYDPNSPAYAPGSPAYVPNSPQYDPNSPQYVPGSPAYAPQTPSNLVGGSVNIFPEDPNMNAAFNMLNGSSQSKILQMEGEQRRIVMGQIMRQSARQSGENTIQQNQSGNTPLVPYFEALTVKNQLTALQGGYTSMSKEFNNLAKTVNHEKITITKPRTVQEELAGKLPLLSVEQKGGNTESSTPETSTNISSSTPSSDNTSSNSSSNSSSNTSSDSSIKKISFV